MPGENLYFMTTGGYRLGLFCPELLCGKKKQKRNALRQVGLKLAPIHGTVHWSQLTPLLLEVLMDTFFAQSFCCHRFFDSWRRHLDQPGLKQVPSLFTS